MATPRSICTSALSLLGITQPGRAPAENDMKAASDMLRMMLDSWSTQLLTIYQTTTLVFDFVPNQATYSLGPTGDWVTERPMTLDYCYVRYAAGSGTPVDTPVQILNDAQRAAITAKSILSPIPTSVYYNAEVPNAKLTFWPVPSSTYSAVLWLNSPLLTFDNLSDELQFPRGYEQALVYNLAIQLAPMYNKSVKPEVIVIAEKSMSSMKTINASPRYLRCPDVSKRNPRGPNPILDGSQW